MERTRRSSKKCHKVSYGGQNMPSVDRLSDLPDDVICHILSFLPTKLSVATSILARRWRFLWAHVPHLEFNYYNNYRTQARYSDIINRVMFLHKVQSINTFRLYCRLGGHTYELETWITIAISRNVRNIDFSLHNKLMLPQCLFTCKTLVSLRLDCYADIPSSGTVTLPCLKKLHLYYVKCQVDKTIPHFLSGCPLLEELIVNVINGVGGDLGCFNISSPTIKRLTVKIPPHKVEIYAPALRYLRFDDCWYKHVLLCPLTSLIEAHICLDENMVKEDYDNPLYVLDFLNHLHNVKCLKLSGVNIVFKDMGTTESSRPILKLDNLIKLEFDGDWHFLTRFLECADNLEVLIIREFIGSAADKDKKIWMEPVERWPACLYSLRTITFDKFWCREREFNMARYLMRNAKVLKRMGIHLFKHFFPKTKDDAIERISSFERGSEACELVFH